MKKTSRKINKLLFRESFFCLLFSFVVLGLITLIGLNFSFFTPFNNAFKDFSYLDLYFTEKLDKNLGNINQDIILVNIDQLERKEIAVIMNKLDRQKPKVIGLDVIFKEEKSTDGDKVLAESHGINNLVTSYAMTNFGVVKSISTISAPHQNSGYSNFSFNPETSVVRDFQGVRKDGDSLQISFGAAVAKVFLNGEWNQDLENYLHKNRPINYKGNREHFLILEPEDVLSQDTIPIVKDKIVLLGFLGDAQNHQFNIEDKHFTPMNEKFVGKSAPDTFGLVVHANIINMIITADFISVVPQWILVLFTILITYLALTYFIWLANRQLASYVLRLNVTRLSFIVFFVWVSLLLFRNGVLFKTSAIIAVAAFSVGLIGYYKKIAHLLYKKLKWNGYFYHD